MLKKIIWVVIAAAIVSAIALAWQLNQALFTPLPVTAELSYHLKPGSSFNKVIQELQAEKLINKPLYIKLYARFCGIAANIKAGEYLFKPGMSAYDILQLMQTGKVILHHFTIIEGWTFKQLMAALRDVDTLEHTIDSKAAETDIMRLVAGEQTPHLKPEGWFYPETYAFPRGMTDVAFLKRAYNDMRVRLKQEWEARAPSLPINSAYEALILASIIERESAVADERRLIAAVFINRLNIKMRLQTDPTVIYGMGDAFDGDIRFRDLRRDTPYNTYTRAGLPPTPIAMPSGEAVHAALNPVDSNALYFVARGDGSHKFSVTLAEHEAAVDEFQRRRKRR